MSAPAVRLEADGLDPLVLDPYAGYVVRSLDFGDAATRSVVDDAPDADGTIDTTRFTGARVVQLTVALVPVAATKEAMRRRLRAFTAAGLAVYMYVTLDDLDEQRIQLRRSKFGNVIQHPGLADCVVQWVGPLGILESSELHSAFVYASDPTPPGGRTYPLTFPRVYPAAGPTGVVIVNNAGDATAYPLLRLYGPATEPIIENLTQDKLLEFDSLTINAGEFLEIDTRAKTILLNGDPTAPAYDKLLYPNSAWWTLSPGDNEIKYRPATFTAATTVAEVVWRDAYL